MAIGKINFETTFYLVDKVICSKNKFENLIKGIISIVQLIHKSILEGNNTEYEM